MYSIQKTNGQIKVVNKTIVKILKRKVDKNPKTWAELLPKIMWAYKTSIETTASHTPFTLAFRLEALDPSELVWPTTRILGYDDKHNEEMMIEEEDYHDQVHEEAI